MNECAYVSVMFCIQWHHLAKRIYGINKYMTEWKKVIAQPQTPKDLCLVIRTP
jgi:hypothetical protein